MCCHYKQNKEQETGRRSSPGRGNSRRKQSGGRRGGDRQSQRDVRQVSKEVNAGSSANSEDFYVFYTGDTDDRNCLKLQIEDKIINVIVDSGAGCNLMSEELFDLVTGGSVKLLECSRNVLCLCICRATPT